jgi:hypothetical protein
VLQVLPWGAKWLFDLATQEKWIPQAIVLPLLDRVPSGVVGLGLGGLFMIAGSIYQLRRSRLGAMAQAGAATQRGVAELCRQMGPDIQDHIDDLLTSLVTVVKERGKRKRARVRAAVFLPVEPPTTGAGGGRDVDTGLRMAYSCNVQAWERNWVVPAGKTCVGLSYVDRVPTGGNPAAWSDSELKTQWRLSDEEVKLVRRTKIGSTLSTPIWSQGRGELAESSSVIIAGILRVDSDDPYEHSHLDTEWVIEFCDWMVERLGPALRLAAFVREGGGLDSVRETEA